VSPSDSKSTSAVLVAAGRSTRMSGGSDRKPFLELEGRTILEAACEAFDGAPNVAEIVVVGHPEDLERIRGLAAESRAMAKVRRVVAGGSERSDSVRAGTAACSDGTALVAIHDVARPLVTTELVERAIAVAAVRGAAIVALPATDTMKTSSDGQNAESTLDRSVLWSAQTPQVFRKGLFLELLDRALADGYSPTDDAALHETYVGPVPIVPGDPSNLKITRPEDLVIAAAILRERAARSKGRKDR
jgi:2-C-methyl-D-erythritol 4-phosphate cytidylyltransferase